MSRAEPSWKAGDRLGPYELVKEIGRGGFASVWLAKRPGPAGFSSRVAIKMIRADVETDPAFQKMFIDEARLAAEVNHPNVVNIFELGEEGDVLYLVMEHVAGRPLSVLRNLSERADKPIPAGIVMRILSDTCAGLHAAHEATRDGKPLGVIHRDVSPQNILVSTAGTVKLIDFGVAKANDRLSADTREGHTKGKLRYMAPEQALAKPVDRRADIWAVGAVAYDLLEGHAPYDGYNELVRLFKLLETTPPAPFTKDVPEPLAKVVFRALERDPEKRFQTAAEMRTAIEDALGECGLRIGHEEVARQFGAWLSPDEPLDDESDESLVERRLRRRSLHGRTAMPTEDVPLPATEASASREAESLAALDTTGTVPVRSRRPLAYGAIGLGVLVGVLGVWKVAGGGSTASQPSASVVEPAPPPPDPRATVPAPSASIEAFSTPAVPTDSSTSTTTSPSPSTMRTRRPPRIPKTAPSASHRKYDDTIQ